MKKNLIKSIDSMAKGGYALTYLLTYLLTYWAYAYFAEKERRICF